MDHSTRDDMSEPSQEIVQAMPKGYPPTREHRNGADFPMGGDLQARLAEISKQNLAECPEGSVAGDYYKDR